MDDSVPGSRRHDLVRVLLLADDGGLLGNSWPRRTGRVVLFGAVAVLAAAMSWRALHDIAVSPALQWGLAVAAAVPVLLALKFPLPAWLVLLLLEVVAPILGTFDREMWRLWGWPWTPGLALGASLVGYTVAARHRAPVAIGVCLLTTAGAAVNLHDWRDIALVGVLAAGVLLLGTTMRLRRQAAAARARQAGDAAHTAVLRERARIARELHDVVAHHMSLLALRTDSVAYRVPELPEAALAEFAALHGIAREGMTELRTLLGVLREEEPNSPPHDDTAPQPGVAEVVRLVDDLREQGSAVEYRHTGTTEALPAGVSLSVYRIVQEALRNATRHAPGAPLRVDLDTVPGTVDIKVHNGPAALPASEESDTARSRHGLVGMRERAAMLGGTITTGVTEAGGFLVTVSLPTGDPGEVHAA